MGYECKYCGTILTTKYNLKKHQRTTRYCLEKQEETIKKYTCSCGRKYLRFDNLQRHQKSCKNVVSSSSAHASVEEIGSEDEELLTGSRRSDLIDTLVERTSHQVGDQLMKQLRDLIGSKELSEQEKRNVTLNGLPAITAELLQQFNKHLSLHFINAGAKGYADYAGEYPLQGRIICTDRARKRLRYRDENGDISDNSRKLTQQFFQAIAERNKELINHEYETIHNEVKEIVAENRAGTSDITGLLTRSVQLQDTLTKCQGAAEGVNNEFTQEFIKHLVKVV